MSGQALREVDTFRYKGITKGNHYLRHRIPLESFLVVLDGFWLKHSRDIFMRQLPNHRSSSENVLKSLLNSGNGKVRRYAAKSGDCSIIIGFLLKLNVAAGGSGIFTKNPRSSRLRFF